MGKGDQKTRRGKLFRGTYGRTRPRKRKSRFIVPGESAEKRVMDKQTPPVTRKEEEPVVEEQVIEQKETEVEEVKKKAVSEGKEVDKKERELSRCDAIRSFSISLKQSVSPNPLCGPIHEKRG